MMEYCLGFIIYSFLFLSLANINDTFDFFSPCTNASLESGIPAINFCKESIAASNVSIVLDGYYAHSLANVTACTCVARSQKGQRFELSHANFGNGIGVLFQPCSSEIAVSNSNSAGFIMPCRSFGSLPVDDNGEITMVLRKLHTTADTRYCILAKLQSDSTFNITCEGNRASVPELTTMSTTTSITTTHDTIITTTTYDTVPETTVSVLEVSTSDKSKTGLIVSTAIGWCFGFVFVASTIILLYQRRNYMKVMKEKTYDELHTRDARNYSTIGENNIGGQEYEIVTI